MTNLVFDLPTRETPGYLRRQREALRFMRLLKEDPSEETIDSLVDFLVQYVSEPKEPEAATDALWDASQEQFEQLLNALTGQGEDEENPTE